MRALRLALVPILSLGLAGACTGGGGGDQLRITEIEVTGETDFGSLEVEVHLFDALDHTFLGCAGQDHGLEAVDLSDTTYAVSAYFRAPDFDRELDSFDLAGRTIEIQVVEDDDGACPVPPGASDDVIGITAGLDFYAGQTVAFDDVTRLRIAIE